MLPTPTSTVAADAEARLKSDVRRFYALAELVDTERGYVNDLRVLVEVRCSLSYFYFFTFTLLTVGNNDHHKAINTSSSNTCNST